MTLWKVCCACVTIPLLLLACAEPLTIEPTDRQLMILAEQNRILRQELSTRESAQSRLAPYLRVLMEYYQGTIRMKTAVESRASVAERISRIVAFDEQLASHWRGVEEATKSTELFLLYLHGRTWHLFAELLAVQQDS